MASAIESRADVDTITDSLTRVSLQAETGDDNRVGPDGELQPRTDEEYAQSLLTIRAIVSSKEAGVIIGKAGKNVADLRDETGVKAGVSKVVQGVHDRVLTVTGALEGISKAYAIVAKGLLEGVPQMGMGGVISTNGTHRKSASNCSYMLRMMFVGDFILGAKTFIYILTFKLTHDRLQRFAYSFPTTKWEQSLVGKA